MDADKIIIWGFVGLVAVCAVTDCSVSHFTKQDVNFKIDKLVEGGGENKFLVFATKDNGIQEVLQNDDSFWNWKFNTADMQANLKEGGSYSATVNGWRIPIFSMYRNILKINEIKTDELTIDSVQMERQRKIQQLEQQLQELKENQK